MTQRAERIAATFVLGAAIDHTWGLGASAKVSEQLGVR